MCRLLHHWPALPVLLAVSAARAEPSPAEERAAFRLEYDMAPGIVGCPKERDFASIASVKFGYDLFPEGARARLVVRIRRATRGLEAALEARDEKGQTQWEAVAPSRPRCRDLAEDIASLLFARFLVSGDETWMLLHASAPPAPDLPPAAPPPPASAPAAPPPPPSSSTPPPPVLASTLPFKRELSAAFVFAPLDTPHVAFGGAVQVAFRWPWASVGAELRGVVDHRGDIDGRPIRTWLATGIALPCVVFGERVRACSPIAGGMYQAVAEGLDASDGAFQGFFAAGLRLSYDQIVGTTLSVRVYGEALLAPRGAKWSVRHVDGSTARDDLWETPIGLPSIGIGVAWKPGPPRLEL